MQAFQRITLWAVILLVPVLLLGIYRRSLYRTCHWLVPYLASVMLGDLLQVLWTDRFYQWWFWLTKETLYGALKLALAIELGALIFAAFPGAAATMRRASRLSVVGLSAALLAARPTGARLEDVAMELHPRLANGTAFLFLTIWLLALWYHVPTHPFHRALLGGLSAYLLVFTLLIRFLGRQGWEVRHVASYGDAVGYLSMLGYWTWVAWRQTPLPGPPDLLRRLQPWRDTLSP